MKQTGSQAICTTSHSRGAIPLSVGTLAAVALVLPNGPVETEAEPLDRQHGACADSDAVLLPEDRHDEGEACDGYAGLRLRGGAGLECSSLQADLDDDVCGNELGEGSLVVCVLPILLTYS